MSLTEDRREFADALSSVDDVTGHPYRPRTLPTGTAWPLLQGLDRGPANDYETTWQLVVILPADEVKASEWFDAHHEPITEALADIGYVDRVEPGLVRTDSGDLEAMFLTVRREA